MAVNTKLWLFKKEFVGAVSNLSNDKFLSYVIVIKLFDTFLDVVVCLGFVLFGTKMDMNLKGTQTEEVWHGTKAIFYHKILNDIAMTTFSGQAIAIVKDFGKICQHILFVDGCRIKFFIHSNTNGWLNIAPLGFLILGGGRDKVAQKNVYWIVEPLKDGVVLQFPSFPSLHIVGFYLIGDAL